MTDRGGKALAQAVQAAYAQGQTDYSLEPMVRTDAAGKPISISLKPMRTSSAKNSSFSPRLIGMTSA